MEKKYTVNYDIYTKKNEVLHLKAIGVDRNFIKTLLWQEGTVITSIKLYSLDDKE